MWKAETSQQKSCHGTNKGLKYFLPLGSWCYETFFHSAIEKHISTLVRKKQGHSIVDQPNFSLQVKTSLCVRPSTCVRMPTWACLGYSSDSSIRLLTVTIIIGLVRTWELALEIRCFPSPFSGLFNSHFENCSVDITIWIFFFPRLWQELGQKTLPEFFLLQGAYSDLSVSPAFWLLPDGLRSWLTFPLQWNFLCCRPCGLNHAVHRFSCCLVRSP